MSRNKDKGRLPPFVPVDREMMRSPAWRATSHGARSLVYSPQIEMALPVEEQRPALSIAPGRAGGDGPRNPRQYQPLVSRA